MFVQQALCHEYCMRESCFIVFILLIIPLVSWWKGWLRIVQLIEGNIVEN